MIFLVMVTTGSAKETGSISDNFRRLAQLVNQPQLTEQDVQELQKVARFPEDLTFLKSFKPGRPVFADKKYTAVASQLSLFLNYDDRPVVRTRFDVGQKVIYIDGRPLKISLEQSIASQVRGWSLGKTDSHAFFNWNLLSQAEAQDVADTPANRFISLHLFFALAYIQKGGFVSHPESDRGMRLEEVNDVAAGRGPWKCSSGFVRGKIKSLETPAEILLFESVKTKEGVGTKICLRPADESTCLSINTVASSPARNPELHVELKMHACYYKGKVSELLSKPDQVINGAKGEEKPFLRSIYNYAASNLPSSPLTLACHTQVYGTSARNRLPECLAKVCAGEGIKVPLESEIDLDKSLESFDIGALDPAAKPASEALSKTRKDLRGVLEKEGVNIPGCESSLSNVEFDFKCILSEKKSSVAYRAYERALFHYRLVLNPFRKRVVHALQVALATYSCCQDLTCSSIDGPSQVRAAPGTVR